MAELTIIIPVYNEEKSIKQTLTDVKASIKKIPGNCEIIVINDGSTDNTSSVISKESSVEVIKHKANKGYGASIKTGIRFAKYNNICIVDADGTYPIKKIPELFNIYIESKSDMVVGARTGKDVTHPLFRKIFNTIINSIGNYITGVKIPDINSGLRIFNKKIAMKFYNLYPDGFSFTTTITMSMLSRGYEVEFIPINYFKRLGKSKISPFWDTINFFSLLIKILIYYNPLKIFMPFVLLFLLISIFFLYRDVFIIHNLSQSTVLFPIITLQLLLTGLIADLISKK
ncbi:MAG: glycosyltransferase family 2 protein [bacterium]